MAHTIPKNTGVFRPGMNGGIFRYPLGTILPVDPWTARPIIANWDPRLGGVSDEGSTSNTKRDSEKKKDWNGDKVRAIQTGKDDTLKLSFIEPNNPRVMEEYFGKANVTVTPATATHGTLISSVSNSDVLPHFAYIIDVFDGPIRKRRCIPDAQVSEIGDEVFKSADWTVYPLTYDLFPDLAGNTFYDYTELDDKLVETNFTVTIGGTPTGGTFTLSVGTDQTAPIAYNAAAAAVKSALEDLPAVGASNAVVTGSAGGPYTVKITTAGAAQVSGSAAALTPSGTVTITQA